MKIRMALRVALRTCIVATACLGQMGVAETGRPLPIVDTASGQIEGVAIDPAVNAYLGIPYAAAPVRDLRWRDPQPVQPWQGVLHADRFGPQCIQPLRKGKTNQYSGAEVSSEDCLYLNVWASPAAKKAPVILFIHGGGDFIGSGSMPLYGGEDLARAGAVFVNLNYRLGVLGFLAHPALSQESPHGTSGNYGLLDQIAALQWVHDNIAQFGGDPGNVTIMGQSAGSMSVLALQASPLTKGLFQRAVGMSGALLGNSGPGELRSLAQGERDGERFQELMKAQDVESLRIIPADRLVVPRDPSSPGVGPIQDGYMLPQPILDIFRSKQQNDVPLLLGFTQDEALGGLGPVNSLADYRARAAATYGDRSDRFLALYPATNDAEARLQAHLADRDATMVTSMKMWATAQTTYGRSPVFSYMFARPHSYAPGVTFPDLDPETAGAYHTSEVPFWLGTLDSFNIFRVTRSWTADDRQFSDMMTKSLLAFARSGNPASPALPWPKFTVTQPKLIQLADKATVQSWPSAQRLAFFEELPARKAP